MQRFVKNFTGDSKKLLFIWDFAISVLMIPQYPLCLCFFRLYHTLSLFFQLVSFVLVGVAAYARVVTVVTSLALVGGVISCGVFLFFTALIGLIGACRHHQVLLFFVSLETFLRQIFYIVTFFFSILEHSVRAVLN